MDNEMTVNAGEMWKGMTLHVKLKGIKIWQVRMWIMTRLIYLAAYIGGCGIELETVFVTEEESDGKS